MTKFISVKELRSETAMARLRQAAAPRAPRGTPLGRDFEDPFSEDGEDDGMDQDLPEQEAAPEPAPAPQVIQNWMPHDINVDSIRSITPRLNGQPGGRIVLKNEKNIPTVETMEELRELLRSPWEV